MNLETTVQRQVGLNYRLNDFTMQLRVVVEKIVGEEANKVLGEEKPTKAVNGLLDELQYLQENNKEILQEAEILLKRLSEVTWMPSTPVETECR